MVNVILGGAVVLEVGIFLQLVEEGDQFLDRLLGAQPNLPPLDHNVLTDKSFPFAAMGAHARAPVIELISVHRPDNRAGASTSTGNKDIVLMIAVQCRMARAALGWGVRDLAKQAGVSIDTVTRLEKGEVLLPRTIEAVQRALEEAGVTFVAENGEGPGVRLRKSA